MTKPTLGRIVLYQRLGGVETHPAIVTHVYGKGVGQLTNDVDLIVFTRDHAAVFTHVPENTGPDETPNGDTWRWMPYQKAVAAGEIAPTLHAQQAQQPATVFDFGQAVRYLKDGMKVTRLGWNGKGMFLFLVPGSTFKVNRAPLLGIYPEGTEINYQSHIDMKTAQDTVVPWLASQGDVLAEDWTLLS
jgi:hypothetical protein